MDAGDNQQVNLAFSELRVAGLAWCRGEDYPPAGALPASPGADQALESQLKLKPALAFSLLILLIC